MPRSDDVAALDCVRSEAGPCHLPRADLAASPLRTAQARRQSRTCDAGKGHALSRQSEPTGPRALAGSAKTILASAAVVARARLAWSSPAYSAAGSRTRVTRPAKVRDVTTGHGRSQSASWKNMRP